jgi:hypothetical protein
VRATATRRVLITGTPIQNNLGELFALADLARPGVLGSRADFQTRRALWDVNSMNGWSMPCKAEMRCSSILARAGLFVTAV